MCRYSSFVYLGILYACILIAKVHFEVDEKPWIPLFVLASVSFFHTLNLGGWAQSSLPLVMFKSGENDEVLVFISVGIDFLLH
jgi:hypothetical protein